MYYYLYDSFVADKKYSSTVNKIETRLMDLGLAGQIEKLTILKSFKEIIAEAIKRGAKTLVAVGDDSTVSKMISLLPNLSVTIGIIPVGHSHSIAEALGIPLGEAACDVLSARLVEKIDLGKANGAYFIRSLSILAHQPVTVDYGTYQVSPLTEDGTIDICNFHGSLDHHCSPKDGILEAVFSAPVRRTSLLSFFRTTYDQASVFPFTKIKIQSNEPLSVLADGQTTLKTPLTVEVVPKKLKIIVGKNRMF